MRKISVILPVYNEEILLPALLENTLPHVDEIVIVDGGPGGPSTDSTAIIAQEHGDKVKYSQGTYALPDGGWDVALQKNTAIASATGDVLVFMSADMYFNDLGMFRKVLEDAGRFKIFFCSMVEFWLDINHMRLYSQNGNNMLTVPGPVVDTFAVDASLAPYYDTNGGIQVGGVVAEERLLLPQLFRFHFGWIKPFRIRVETHKTHVRQHRWGDEGEGLLLGDEREFQKWAIMHVMSYPQTPCVDFQAIIPPEMEACRNMRYDQGHSDVVKEFEDKYNVSVFKGWRPE